MNNLKNKRISDQTVIASPNQIHQQFSISSQAQSFVMESRRVIEQIIRRQDPRLLVICGPCSLHDIQAAKDYAQRLKTLHQHYADALYIVMRTYFEKPRTCTGWKGMINDPALDGSFDIETGLKKARSFLTWLAELRLPGATETLDHITPQYLSDLISWVSIGARTIESQTHREMASGLSMSVGFKNSTDGDLSSAINAMASARETHAFLGINEQGRVAVMHTCGNPSTHLILRGGRQPNYDARSVQKAKALLKAHHLNPAVMIDCSHANSCKDYRNQAKVLQDVQAQLMQGESAIIGLMLESNLYAGQQQLNLSALQYGVSITDACLGWEETKQLLDKLYHTMRDINTKSQCS